LQCTVKANNSSYLFFKANQEIEEKYNIHVGAELARGQLYIWCLYKGPRIFSMIPKDTFLGKVTFNPGFDIENISYSTKEGKKLETKFCNRPDDPDTYFSLPVLFAENEEEGRQTRLHNML